MTGLAESPWTIPESALRTQTTHEMLMDAIAEMEMQNVPFENRVLRVTKEQLIELRTECGTLYRPLRKPGTGLVRGTYHGIPMAVTD